MDIRNLGLIRALGWERTSHGVEFRCVTELLAPARVAVEAAGSRAVRVRITAGASPCPRRRRTSLTGPTRAPVAWRTSRAGWSCRTAQVVVERRSSPWQLTFRSRAGASSPTRCPTTSTAGHRPGPPARARGRDPPAGSRAPDRGGSGQPPPRSRGPLLWRGREVHAPRPRRSHDPDLEPEPLRRPLGARLQEHPAPRRQPGLRPLRRRANGRDVPRGQPLEPDLRWRQRAPSSTTTCSPARRREILATYTDLTRQSRPSPGGPSGSGPRPAS